MILTKLKSQEMPPEDVLRPEAEINALVKFLETEFARADAAMKPDPGRVTARRLNRAEYTNTIRDLLAIEFRADKNFPTDDSGDGFDNIGDVLTVSPVLMEKYLSAAGRIAERAIVAGPLPKPIEVEYSLRFKNLRRLDPSNVEATHRFDFDADYELKIGLPGQRAKDAAPVTLGLWVDGKLAHTQQIETKPSGLVYFNPYSEERIRVADPRRRSHASPRIHRRPVRQDARQGGHLQGHRQQVDRLGDGHRPVCLAGREAEPQEDPGVRSRDGSARASIASWRRWRARAYRRPVTARGSRGAAQVRRARARPTGSRSRRASPSRIQAMLVSPHFLFHIERDLYPNDPTRVHRISDVELASRLSYFLWNSMPDDELLSLAERRRLSTPARARGAGDADARRSEGVRDGGEFRRPVAGDSQSRQHQAGSAEVPGLDGRSCATP